VLEDKAELRQNFSEIWFPKTLNITTHNKYADRGFSISKCGVFTLCQQYNFHQPYSNLPLYQKGVSSAGMEAFNSLSQSIKNLSDNPK
jgi:hypothetical protein